MDKEVEEKIREAARILREDGHSVRLKAIEDKLAKHFPDEPEGDPAVDDDGNPKPPPKKDPAESETDRKPKRGWWPDDAEAESS